MAEKEELLIHYWQLPGDIFITLKKEFHISFSNLIQKKLTSKYKNCFHQILNCPKWHAQRLFTQFTRFTIKEIEILQDFSGISKEEVENNIETIGNHEDGTIIKNPKLPFNLKDLFYVASHLFFDGSFRFKEGNYFYSYESSLTEYHKQRLSNFGEVPINLIEKENQLYFSYTLGYIAAKVLDINNFKSKSCILSEKFKDLAKKNKTLADEIIKALIIDESDINEKVRIELSNQKLIEDLHEIFRVYYNLANISTRERKIEIEESGKIYNYLSTSWKFCFSTSSFKELYKSISPIPISYKEENLKTLVNIQSRNWYKKKPEEMKKLIVESLIKKPKSVSELSKELQITQSTIRSHINGSTTYSESLISSGKVVKVGERILKKGGYAKENIFGAIN